ncbi:MAG: hypothetical protein KDA28_05130, partial [Phycisphaerales bacterium]|nr:hypothetical protein [Phycisphaerales bacterium]
MQRLVDLVEGVHDDVVDAAREVLDAERSRRSSGESPRSVEDLEASVRVVLEAKERGHLRRAINATGILLHTGLGR